MDALLPLTAHLFLQNESLSEKTLGTENPAPEAAIVEHSNNLAIYE